MGQAQVSGALSPEEALNQVGFVIHQAKGYSMQPFIHSGDTVIVSRTSQRLKKYDIALYKAWDQYIIHRCISVRKNDYVFAGDHNTFKEPGLTDDQILGVVMKILRGRQEVPLTGWRYRLYCHLWVDFFPLRCFIIKAKKVFRRSDAP